MKKPKICAAITAGDLASLKEIEPLADLLEVRIDLIGEGWREVARGLNKPWIACNRLAAEGGRAGGSEKERTASLLEAIELGASIIDIELNAPGLEEVVRSVKPRAECLISYHDLSGTPPLAELERLLERQVQAGADICKIVTTAASFEDNMIVIGLVSAHPDLKLVSFAMGPAGVISRVLGPLAGGYFTYASAGAGLESAPGQINARDLRKLYEMIGK